MGDHHQLKYAFEICHHVDATYHAYMAGLILIDPASERGREGRIVRLISDTRDQQFGATAGFGIDENTALVITDVDTENAMAEVLGEAGVFFADLSNAVANEDSTYWSIVDVRAAYLTEGDVMSLTTGEITVGDWKTSTDDQESNDEAHVSNDIFNGNLDYPLRLPEFPYTAASLFDARYDSVTYGLTYELTPRFRVWMIQDVLSKAHKGTNPRNGRDYLSYSKLLVQMEENQIIP